MIQGQTEQFLINPFIVSEAEGKDFRFYLPYYQFSFSGPPGLKDLIGRLNESGNLSKNAIMEWVDSEVFDWLTEYYILLGSSSADALKYGIFNYYSSLTPGFNLLHSSKTSPYTMIGLPFHTNSFGSMTTRFGPQLVRNCFRDKALPPNLQDAGDIIFLPHIEPLATIQHRIAVAFRRCIAGRSRPIFVGGDHSLTYYSCREACTHYPDLRLIQIDAHSDVTKSKLSMLDHLTNANFIRKLLEHDKPSQVVQFGVRDGKEINNERVQQLELKDTRDWLAMQTSTTTPCFLTIDIDCLDPEEAPEVNHPISGGLKIGELIKWVSVILQNCNVVAIDLMEIGATGSPKNRAASMAAKTIQTIAQ